ncbi:hypothetical protein EPO05_03825 [Patescibacteria group bacterium]|nr:MAG: hypothetical protein EPO05_03825 [Patescibacteria group bacterium]
MGIQNKALVVTALSLIIILPIVWFFTRSAGTPAQPKVEVKGAGGEVKVNDPRSNPSAVLSPQDVVVKKTNRYEILYYAYQEESFLISITDGVDPQGARAVAEKDFLTTLGVNEADACKLNVSLTVPRYANQELAGVDYGLSFCPNGKMF